MEKSIDEIFEKSLKYKESGGVPLDIFVSDGIWLGGMFESRSHAPFVAIGPSDWESEEELTFFKSEDEVNQFIKRLQEASKKAFNPSRSK